LKTLLHIAAAIFGVGFLILLGLRGLVLVTQDSEGARLSGEAFLMAASSELDNWYTDSGEYPQSLNGLRVSHEARDGMALEGAYGGILRAPLIEIVDATRAVTRGELLDPWGRPWRYTRGEDGDRIRLASWGPDRAPGGTGEDRDLVLTRVGLRSAFAHLDQAELW